MPIHSAELRVLEIRSEVVVSRKVVFEFLLKIKVFRHKKVRTC